MICRLDMLCRLGWEVPMRESLGGVLNQPAGRADVASYLVAPGPCLSARVLNSLGQGKLTGHSGRLRLSENVWGGDGYGRGTVGLS